tara:strand:+ start:834 stop:1034 length:201 start_codon:yes stop_codon:yes gene_type:complete
LAAAVAVVQTLGLLVQAAQALSSSPTHPQHNYSAVALLPKQVASSSTRSHHLAHLARLVRLFQQAT